RRGVRCAVVEAREAGGTCLNRGCIPTKALLHASELRRSIAAGAECGIHAEGLRVEPGEIFAYQRRVSATLVQGVESLLKSAKIPLLRGRAQITAPHTVRISSPEGERSVTADRILIACGAEPIRPPIPGIELEGVLTSDDVLRGSERLFRSVVIIGGGVIGIEFACFYAGLGCEVTLLEGLDRLLPNLDREIGQNLALILKKQNVRVAVNAAVRRIEKEPDGLRVSYSAKSGEETASGEAVICAVGRRPLLKGLFAEGLEPERDGAVLRVDESFETTVPGVYAVGDAATPVQFAHVAAAQGAAFADRITGAVNPTDLRLVPTCIHCCPEIAVIGLSEAEAKAAGIPVKTGKCVMGGNALTLIADPGRSFMKLVAHAQTGALLGAQLMCPHAGDMISQLGQAIANGWSAAQLLSAMRPHPTFEEALGDALSDLNEKLKSK
ncbi:MAG: FAD-dependent oxidoreductase, partial [Oscillospiraceae bacterium]|nr:FAD-dependent oxidoreductase [Oscillospiraceae bacterium]